MRSRASKPESAPVLPGESLPYIPQQENSVSVCKLDAPTAITRFVPGTLVTPNRLEFAELFGLETTLHALPSQCSISAGPAIPVPIAMLAQVPTAQMLSSGTAAIPLRMLLLNSTEERKKAPLENLRKYGNGPFRVAVIHGGPGAAGSVAPLARKLGERRGVLEPLQTAKTLDGQVEELRLVVEQHATTPVVFIGHSWGAWLSALVTATYPELVRKLILVGSGPLEEQYVPLIAQNRIRRLSQEEQEEYRHLVEMLNTADTPNSRISLSRLGTLAHKADSYDPIEIPEDLTARDFVVDPGEMYQGVWSQAAKLRATGELLRLVVTITCPVVAIHGDSDPHPAEGVQEPLAAHLKDFRMITLEKCGHDPWCERDVMERFYEILEHELSSSR